MVFSKIKSLFQHKSTDVFIGIIDEDGVYKDSSKNKPHLSFCFVAYTKNDSQVHETEAVVYKVISNGNANTQGLEPLSIVKIEGEQIDHHGQNRIILSSIVKTNVKHDELQKIKEKRMQPVRFESETFGTFLLNRADGWFETKAKWNEDEIEIFLSGEQSELPELENQATQLFSEQANWEAQFKRKISADLLSLKNETWLDEDETPLTDLEFQQRIKLESLHFFEDGEFQANYIDGDLFWGHWISLYGNVNGQIENAGLQG